jgi:CubicO group peptidase (beta-lactamase class C family)
MQIKKSIFASSVIYLLLLLVSMPFAVSAAVEPGFAERDRGALCEQVETYIQQQMTRLNLPGAALAIVEGDEIVCLRAFGEAITPQTPFFIGSLTKSFTALAVMQLVEDGKIDLDAPIQQYLPWFQMTNPQASAQMTVRHLLIQNSGLSQSVGMIPLAEFDAEPNATERLTRRLATVELARPIGSAWEYSNMNYNILGLIIEAASGETYESYIQNHIFTPLEMQHSHTSKADARRDHLAVGHRFWFGTPLPEPDLPVPLGSLPSGQLISSAEDMAHYLIAYLNDGRYRDTQVLSPEGIAELHRPAVQAASMGVKMGAYGMGWFVETTERGTRLWHNGQVPDYFAYMTLLPEQNRGLVLLVNANQMMMNFALLGFGEDTATLLAGIEPEPFPWGVFPWLFRSFLLIPVFQFIGFIATQRRLKRWQLEPSHRPGLVRLWIFHIALPIFANLLLVLGALSLLTSDLRRMILLFMPDLSWLILVCGGFAFIWIFARTWLVLTTAERTPK